MMDEAQRAFWVNFRAALLKEAHDLQEHRAAKLQIAADIKRMLESSSPSPPKGLPVTKS